MWLSSLNVVIVIVIVIVRGGDRVGLNVQYHTLKIKRKKCMFLTLEHELCFLYFPSLQITKQIKYTILNIDTTAIQTFYTFYQRKFGMQGIIV